MSFSKFKYIVGVGLQPSANDLIHHMGHMWIRWTNPFTNEVSHRGYWPVLEDLPKDVNVREYFLDKDNTYKVRGCYKIDTDGREIEEAEKEYKSKNWSFSERAFFYLTMWHCKLPDGASIQKSGMYSINEEANDTHNCSSWAITALRTARNKPNFISCDRIKRLKYVERAIWGMK